MTALAQQLLQQLEAPTAARLDPLFWGRDLADTGLRLTLEQLGRAVGLSNEYGVADRHNERVQYFDPVVRHNEGQELQEGVWSVELPRQAVPLESVAVVDRIETWLRATAVSTAGGPVTWELYDGQVAAGITGIGSPFPFPLTHPDGGSLTVRWLLIREGVCDADTQPAYLGPAFVAGEQLLPWDTPVLPGWRDQRYGWNTASTQGLYFVIGGRSLLRLFCTITIAGAGRWVVSPAARFGGYFQNAGYLRSALAAATVRR